MDINQIKIKIDKCVKELQTLESNTYTLSNHTQYINDLKRSEYLKAQISIYDNLIIELQEK
jgi:hypothetical protein